MKQQFEEKWESKKAHNPPARAAGLARNRGSEPTTEADIDPADFFDPEEFGIGRGERYDPRR